MTLCCCRSRFVVRVHVREGFSGGHGCSVVITQAGAGVSRAGAQEAGPEQGRGPESFQYEARMWRQADGFFTTCQNVLQGHGHRDVGVLTGLVSAYHRFC